MQKALQAPAISIPPEVAASQKQAIKLIAKIRRSWPEKGDSYPADVSYLMVERARQVLGPLERRVSTLLADERSRQDAEARTTAEAFSGFLGRAEDFLLAMKEKIQKATAPQLGPEAEPSQVLVLLPEFREQLVNVLGYAVQSWQALNPAHNVYPLWMDGTSAEDTANALQAFLEEEWKLPGAKKPLHWGWKVGLGVAAAAAAGGGAYVLWRRYQGRRQLMEPEPEEIPTGIHVFGVDEDSGDVHVIDAEFEEYDDGTVTADVDTIDGGRVRLVGGDRNMGAMRQVADFVRKIPVRG